MLEEYKINYNNVFDVLVAKKKSLFDDKSVEIEELTYIVKQVNFHLCWCKWNKIIMKRLKRRFYWISISPSQDINSLNKQIAQLQDLVRSRSGQNGRHIQTHSNTIVVSLQVCFIRNPTDIKSRIRCTFNTQHFTCQYQSEILTSLLNSFVSGLFSVQAGVNV